ncbi:MAG: RelA/SpoT domain-containing protein [Dehalococcoidia bacterium]
MAFEEPAFEQKLIDIAGEALAGYADSIDYLREIDLDPLDVISNWRSAHSYPLNTFQMTLRTRARQVNAQSLVSQRLKRLSAIGDKLDRMPSLKLSEMQDLGGCRAVLFTVDEVYQLDELYTHSGWKHVLDDRDDYIRRPKSSGYRGIHLIYKHCSSKSEWDGLKIEIQLRSALQHVWATAVETADVFLRQGLKASRGSAEWRRFFALMGTALARRENCRRVPKTPSDEGELVAEIRQLVAHHAILPKLEAFGRTLHVIEDVSVMKNARHVILELDMNAPNLRLYGYVAKESEEAARRYMELEKRRVPGVDVVLVSVEHAVDLRRAYPNYYLDTTSFVQFVRETIG